jgi:AraC-like DNA-binding protein
MSRPAQSPDHLDQHDHPDGPLADDGVPAALRARLVERLLRHGSRTGEVVEPAALPGLMLMRLDACEGQMCAVYEPLVALVVQGRKRVVFGEETLVYDPQRFFVTPLELPARSAVLEASPERPFLSLALRLDMREIATLVLEGVEPPPPAPGGERRAMATGAVDAPLLDAFDRLLALLDQPRHAPVLAPLIRREITYRLLTGEAGWRLRQIAAVDSQGHQVSRAITLLRARFAEPLRVDELARAALMSPSSFHHHFKALTGMSPLQFQKALRLGEARRLMLSEHLDAATAAYRVGYESASQFSREYGRQFGAPPVRDISALRQRA